MNHLIHEKEIDIAADRPSAMTEEEFNQKLEQIFDPQFSQNINQAEMIEPLTPGQEAERAIVDMLVAFLRERYPSIRAEHGTMFEDQGAMKSDLNIWIEGLEQPVNVQLTTRTDAGVKKKFEQLPESTIPVILPSIGRVLDVREHGNALDQAGVLKDVFRQILAGMNQRPKIYGQHLKRLLNGQ